MPEVKTTVPGGVDFARIYAQFDAPIHVLNCGDKCSPYNERGVPFCCDTRHAVPLAYEAEWEFLHQHTNLWHTWEAPDAATSNLLRKQAPDGQVLLECLGHDRCQRNYRTLTCRAFPFYPYFTRENVFIGLSYYWQYEDRCWVISNLAQVSQDYRTQFIQTYDEIFALFPEERTNFHYHSMIMRRVFGRWRRALTLLHRNGGCYKVSPRTGRMRRVSAQLLPKLGPYRVAAELPFSDELIP